MSEPAAKRFWKEARAEQGPHGIGIRLDGRPVRTPAGAALDVPNFALAHAIAGEWNSQGEKIDPAAMPLTRMANAALDRVAPQSAEVARIVSSYGESDLLCHRADHPQALSERQARAWDPLLEWAATRLDARLHAVTGVMPAAQPATSLSRLGSLVQRLEPFKLTALHELTAISGSLILALAVLSRHLDAAAAWPRCRVDEDWQAEHWGVDGQAEAAARARRADFLLAERFLILLETEYV